MPFKQETRAWGEQSELELLRETWRYSEYRVALRLGTLKIRHVEGVHADESWGEMNMLEGLEYDESKREVTLVSFGVLRVLVARLAVQAEVTPTVGGYVRRRIGKRLRWASDTVDLE